MHSINIIEQSSDSLRIGISIYLLIKTGICPDFKGVRPYDDTCGRGVGNLYSNNITLNDNNLLTISFKRLKTNLDDSLLLNISDRMLHIFHQQKKGNRWVYKLNIRLGTAFVSANDASAVALAFEKHLQNVIF